MSGESSEFATWEEKRDDLRQRLYEVQPRYDQSGFVKLNFFGQSDPYQLRSRVEVRSAFLDLLPQVVPAVLEDLSGSPLDDLCAFWERTSMSKSLESDTNWLVAILDDTALIHWLYDASAESGSIHEWIRRWGLCGTESGTTPLPSDDSARRRLVLNQFWAGSAATFTLAAWRMGFNRPEEFGRFIDPFRRIFNIDRLANNISCNGEGPTPSWDFGLGWDLGLCQALRLPAQEWNPQFETRAEAARRIRWDLEYRVSNELDRIEQETRAQAEMIPVRRVAIEHLVWLIRYQQGRESYSHIARSACKERQTVTDAVRATAALIGIALRPPDRPGRRPKSEEIARIVSFRGN